MKAGRAPGFWLLLAAGAALSAWWLLYVPCDSARLYSAVPAHATFVSRHRDLASRWRDFSANPFARSLLGALGLTQEELDAFRDDPVAQRWARRLLGRDAAVAFVPGLGDYADPAWVIVSWIGGRSQRLRWQLSWARSGEYTRCAPHRGRPYWVVESAVFESGEKLTVALVEGMIVGCISKHVGAMREVLDTYDGLFPSVAVRADFPGPGNGWGDPLAPDRGWVYAGGLGTWAYVGSRSLAYEFSVLQPSGLVGQVCWRAPRATGPVAPDRRTTAGLAGLFGDLPLALLLLDRNMVWADARPAAGPALLNVVREIAVEQRADTIMLCILGDAYSGRFKGIKVPTVVAGIPVADETKALAAVKKALDRANARRQLGLIPREVPDGAAPLFAIEGTKENAYGGLPLEERFAYAAREGWLLAASSLGGLRRLMAGRGAGRLSQGAAEPRWAKDMGDVQAPFYGWIDLALGGKALRLAVTTYSLKLLMEDPVRTQSARQRLNEIKAWIDSLAPLGTCRVWLESEGDVMRVSFRMGEVDGP